jgi:peptide/nickel transport system substrate-binding protein
MRIRPHRTAALTAVAVTVSLTSACATTSAGEGSAGTDRVVMALTSDPNTFDPTKNVAAADYVAATLLYDTLVAREGESAIPSLATDWKVTPIEGVFTLRKDVTCSDGSPLTASTVAAALDRLPSPAVFGPGEKTVTADDQAGTVTISLSQPWSEMLLGLATPQAGIPCSTDEEALAAGKAPGTGPYTLTKAQRGAGYTYAARSDYTWAPEYTVGASGTRPKELVVNVIQNESTMANQLSTGDLDFAPLVGPDAERFVDESGYTVHRSPLINFMILFNERPGRPAADEKLRRAIAAAVDRDAFSDAAAHGVGQPLTSLVTDGTPCASDLSDLFVSNDPATAKPLSGVKLKLEGTNSIAGGAGNDYVQAALEKAGATVTLKNTDNATWATDVIGNQGDWDVTVFPHLNLTTTIGNAGGLFVGEGGPKGRNVGAVDNPALTKAFSKALATTDEAEQCAAWDSAQRAILERVDAVPLVSAQITYVGNDRVDVANPGGFVDMSTITIAK